ncbi:MAG TPA: carbohydrate binding domain-containing protein [Actinomycetes bacterium]|nr:carbohydrate binding domain-containing protein [Actinomycetes bacterium]
MVVVLAAGVAAAVAVTGGDGSGSIVPELTGTAPTPPTIAPTTSSSATTATTRPPGTATTPPLSAPPQPVQPTPGNLLANGDFERDLAGWGPSGGGRIDRVAIGHSGGWSVRIQPGGSAPRPTAGGTEGPGLQLAQPVQGRPRGSYEASAWVRATRPGTEAILTLRELGGDGDSADVIGVTLPDAGWHEVAVIHQVQTAGRLTLEASARGLPPGEALLLDQISVAPP